MAISDKTYNKILLNTKSCSDIVNKLDLPSSFWESFHFRPTSSGITIVSTLSYAPMRGIKVSLEKLESVVLNILDRLSVLQTADEESGQAELLDMGFKHRALMKSREENIQAMFINGMIAKTPEYLGIEFVASELTLEEKNRFDVIGVKDNTLYLFEMKLKRSFGAAKQVLGYVEFVNDNIEKFKEVLCNYPNFDVKDFTHIKAVTVMEYSERMSKKLISDATEIGVDSWFFNENMTFERF